ncbi:hypothetical protein JSQ81_12155 [Sporosarcina sp. Marseille-Q4063]|uniref:hypothetical protein n=1 Tax=Sporosarcina sp. Marseille-Q4063 TaxID=2810514 RepID=UPI001BAFD409|nr:hypothetical protein [Sporosarcina sp. Marseille-Q4063]QUW20606.1 hypothetical protein JSQ81_12155 [Sporosarcina sp. Marseille-Q4063]
MNDFVLITLLVLLMARTFIKNRDTLRAYKKLSKTQLLGVVITFIFTVVIATTLIFYGKNWIAGKFSNIFLESFIFVVIFFFVFYFIGTISDKVMNKITKGALPKN